jgi:hypothetical protein
MIRHWRGREDWEKTPHTGHHLSALQPAVAAAAEAGAA